LAENLPLLAENLPLLGSCGRFFAALAKNATFRAHSGQIMPLWRVFEGYPGRPQATFRANHAALAGF